MDSLGPAENFNPAREKLMKLLCREFTVRDIKNILSCELDEFLKDVLNSDFCDKRLFQG